MLPSMILTWGSNSFGQCCSGHDGPKLEQRPRCVNATICRGLNVATPVAAVAAGEAHTLLLTGYGDVYACGRSREGQLGLGLGLDLRGLDEMEVHVPMRVEALRSFRITQVACGSMHSVAVTAGGKAFEWGLLLPLERMAEDEVWVAKRHGIGRNFQEDLNERQQRIVSDSWSRYLKNGARSTRAEGETHIDVLSSAECHRVATRLPRPGVGLEDLQIVAVACGFAHTVVAVADGSLMAAGYGDKGQLGNGERFPSPRYIRTILPPGTTCTAAEDLGKDASFRHLKLACGLNHTAAVTAPGGTLLTWGLGVFGQLGLGQSKKEVCLPTAVALSGPAVQVACGNHHTVVLMADGVVFCFGHRDAVGGASHQTRFPEPKREFDPSGGQQVETLFAGGTGCFALVKPSAGGQGVLQSWGYNQKYQLGRYTAELQLITPGPTALPRLAGARVRAFSAGTSHAVAVVHAPSCCVLPPEVGEPFFGSPPLLAALRGASPFDVAVLCEGSVEEPLGAHRSILAARCPELAQSLRRPSVPSLHAWELDLTGTHRVCAAALLEYLYTDHCRANITLATQLRALAERWNLPRLLAGVVAVTETDSLAEGQRWARNAEGKWVQVEVSADVVAPTAASTYFSDLEALVLDGRRPEEESDYLALSVGEVDGGDARTVYVARALLLTVDFFRACLDGEFAEAFHLRSGAAAEIAADDAECLILCLRILATGKTSLLPESPSGLLGVLAEAHRLELPDIVNATESALSRIALGHEAEDLELRADLARAAELYALPKVASCLAESVPQPQ